MNTCVRIIIAGLVLAAFAAAPVAAERRPVATASSSQANRASAKAWWLAQGRIIARSNDYFRKSEEQLKANKVEEARSLLQSAEAEAEHSTQAAGLQVPRGWSDVSQKIRASSGKFKEAMADLLALLNGGDQTLGQRGVAANAAANTAAEEATQLARAHYTAIGGTAGELPSMEQMSAGISSTTR